MALYRLQIELPYDSGLPSDVAVNVWHCVAPDNVEAADFKDNVVGFYQSIDGLFSNLLDNSANACRAKLYALSDAPPRVPILDTTFTLADATGTPQPPEVAVCLSFHGEFVSGQPRSHRRGRVYLGPLDTSVVASDGRLDATAQDVIRDAAQVLVSASGAWDWAVYSVADNGGHVVVGGWVDNEFDTQRRRGRVATTRLTFT